MPSKTRFGLVCLAAFAGMAGLATATGLASAAFHSDRAPPPKAFDLDGERFHWAVAHGVVGSVGLSRRTAVFDDGTEWTPELLITCSGMLWRYSGADLCSERRQGSTGSEGWRQDLPGEERRP